MAFWGSKDNAETAPAVPAAREPEPEFSNVYALTGAQRNVDDILRASPGYATVPSIPETQVAVEEKRKASAAAGFFTKKIKPKELMHFSRQLAAFLRAGIPILDALTMLSMDCENATLAAVLTDVEASLRQGNGLSESFDAHPKAFPPAYRSIVRSAELTGNLDTVLDRLSSYLERDTDARDKIKSAMTYPAVVAVLAVGVVVLLTTFVLPKFRPFFASFHAKLPLPTRLLIAFGDFFSNFWWAIIAVCLAMAVGTFAFIRGRRTRLIWDNWKMRVPAIGPVLRYAVVERFCRVLAAMLQAGVSMPDALRIASEACNNSFVTSQLENARTLIMQGAGIAAPLSRVALFPPAAVQMIRVGESTGTLDEQLEQVATFFERELGYKIKRFTTLIEPTVIIIMGLIVGFVALALVSAMYGVFQTSKVG